MHKQRDKQRKKSRTLFAQQKKNRKELTNYVIYRVLFDQIDNHALQRLNEEFKRRTR